LEIERGEKGEWSEDSGSRRSKTQAFMLILTLRGHQRYIHRQEMPLHRRRFHPRSNPHRCRPLYQNDQHHHHPTRIPTLVSFTTHRLCSCHAKYPLILFHSIPKYRRYEKRHKNLAAHCSPAFRVENGDVVTVGTLAGLHQFMTYADFLGQCRPLSKTVRFNVVRVSKNKAAAKAFNKF
jgi:ribosomal protein S17